MDEKFDLLEHRHRFAMWAAARAAQRGCQGATMKNLCAGLKKAGAPKFIDGELRKATSAKSYDEFHRKICSKICRSLEQPCDKRFTYGRAAKLLAVYLKRMIIVGPEASHPARSFIHPPIDGIMLKNLRADSLRIEEDAWSTFEEDQYWALIKSLRALKLDQPEFWKLERYWSPIKE